MSDKEEPLFHVFEVNSAITILMALRVISFQKLVPKQCIFLYQRINLADFDIPKEIKAVKREMHLNTMGIPDKVRQYVYFIWHSKRELKRIDDLIAALVENRNFYFYGIHLYFPLNELIVTHPKCLGVYFIEEGTAVYLPSFEKYVWKHASSSRQKFLHDVVYKNRLSYSRELLPKKHPKVLGAYAINEMSFQPIDNVIKVGLPFARIEVDPAVKHIVVLDNFKDASSFIAELYIYPLIKLFGHLASQGIHEIHIKYHQQANAASPGFKKLVEEMASQFGVLSLVELSPEVVLENIAFSKPDVYFYGVVSSVLYYASLCNCKVFSFANALIAIDETAKKHNNFVILKNEKSVLFSKIEFM